MMKKIISLMTVLVVCGALMGSAFAVDAEPSASEYDVTWNGLDERIRSGGWNSKTLIENANTIEAIDYTRLEKSLRDNLNEIAEAQWALIKMGAASSAKELEKTYDMLRESFDALRDGDMQKDNDDRLRQINSGMDQVVAGGQTLYLTILDLEQSLGDGKRGLASIERKLVELRLRRDIGQVSSAQVAALEQTYADTASQLKELETGIISCKRQLQSLMGEEPDGLLTLAPLPAMDAELWPQFDYETDLATAKQHSWAVYSAGLTLEDAEETWEEDRDDAKWDYERKMADHTLAAAQATYEASVESFAMSFYSLHTKLDTAYRAWESSLDTVAYQEKLLNIAQNKYELGLISKNALADAQDDLAFAQSSSDRAWRELFSARHHYRNAVQFGIV